MGQFTEKMWPAVPKQILIADGGADGSVQVANTSNYYVGMIVSVSTDGTNANSTQFKIRQVYSATKIYVSLLSQSFAQRANMTAYTVSGGATITADKQSRSNIISDEVIKAVYADEPAVAFRSLLVDKQGNKIDSVVDSSGLNRLAVDAALTVSGLTLSIDALTPPTQANPSNILIAGSEDGTKGGLKHAAVINSKLQLKTGDTNTFLPFEFNSFTIDSVDSNGNPLQVTYKAGATTVGVVTLTYDGSGNLASATRA